MCVCSGDAGEHPGESSGQSSPCKATRRTGDQTQTHGRAHLLVKTASLFPFSYLLLTSLVLTVLAVAFLDAGMHSCHWPAMKRCSGNLSTAFLQHLWLWPRAGGSWSCCAKDVQVNDTLLWRRVTVPHVLSDTEGLLSFGRGMSSGQSLTVTWKNAGNSSAPWSCDGLSSCWGGAVPGREGILAYFFFSSISVFLDLIFFPI